MAKKAARTTTTKKTVETLRHPDSRRTNIPTAEQQSVMETEEKYSIRVAYERRNRDLDPQLVWRGKDEQDAGPLVANAPPLYIQEKVHPKVLIDDLMRRTDDLKDKGPYKQLDLFGDFNGLPEEARSAEFYQHEANWTNRMILGDSLQVMASLAEREGLRGKVQCIYFDPPYGIKFNSNFQWSTSERAVSDGKREHITREPEQVKAFRDTWKDGIHSYLGYLRERLIACRDLLTANGSILLQIGDENVHLVRSLLDEVFGASNCVSQIAFQKTSSSSSSELSAVFDYILWYSKSDGVKYRALFQHKIAGGEGATQYSYGEDSSGERRTIAEWKGKCVVMSSVRSYRDLQVWQKSMELVEAIYVASKTFPPDERYGLTSQMRRAAVSIPSNIAEGAARTATGEFLQFLSHASGSLAETETQLMLAERLQYLSNATASRLLTQTEEIGRMLGGLKRSLKSKS